MIYVTGDTHGDIKSFSGRKARKIKEDDTLIVCGDFGFLWDNSESEQKNINALEKLKYNILFVDGTHENFDILESFPITKFGGSDARQISHNIYHLMRGQIYFIENKSIFTFGGGVSPDIEFLVEADAWYERETPNDKEMELGVFNIQQLGSKLDYIITHEPPFSIKKQLDKKAEINKVNLYLEEIMRNVQYNKWYFGSLHKDKQVRKNMYGIFKKILPIDSKIKPRKF